MLSTELIGRRVRVIAWYDHPPLVAARRASPAPGAGPEGTVLRVDDRTGRVAVLIEGLGRVFALACGDVEALPDDAAGSRPEDAAAWPACPSCHGTGRTAGRSCSLCAGSGRLGPAVAEDPAAATVVMEAGPEGDG
jgi:hypothetical protein